MALGALETAFQSQRLTRRQEAIKGAKFLFFEVSAGVIQILVATILYTGLHLTVWAASYLPALIASVLWSFTANRKFTFKSVSNIPVAMVKVMAYYCLFTPLSTWWGAALMATPWGVSHGAQYYIVLIGTMVINFLTEFCVYRFWVYRRSINSSATGQAEQFRYANP